MNLLSRIRNGNKAQIEQLNFDDWVDYFRFGGVQYPVLQTTQTAVPVKEILPDLYGFSETGMKVNGIVFAAVATRMRLFSEARFKFRPRRAVGSGDLFGGSGLGLFETPWPKATTADLLARISLDIDLAGNSYVVRRDSGTLRIMRPDWTWIILGSQRQDGQIGDIDTQIAGYAYRPPGVEAELFFPDEVAHIMPYPDPLNPYRGMSWLQPVISEIMADNQATTYVRKYFENSATPNMVVKLDVANPQDFDEWVEKFQESHVGARNAFKTLFLAGGADATVVGANLKEVEFVATQAHTETRIAVAAGIPAIVLGITEGLDKSAYTDYAIARRHFADSTMRPLWRTVCGKLEGLLDPNTTPPELPPGASLWYEDRDIPWLAEDQKDAASILQVQAATIASLITAGFMPDAAVQAVTGGDFSMLEHSGLVSVQLLPPGVSAPGVAQPAPAVPNGNQPQNGQPPVPANGRP